MTPNKIILTAQYSLKTVKFHFRSCAVNYNYFWRSFQILPYLFQKLIGLALALADIRQRQLEYFVGLRDYRSGVRKGMA